MNCRCGLQLIKTVRRSSRLAAAASGVAAAFVASPSYAQVMDIAPDGTVSVRTVPAHPTSKSSAPLRTRPSMKPDRHRTCLRLYATSAQLQCPRNSRGPQSGCRFRQCQPDHCSRPSSGRKAAGTPGGVPKGRDGPCPIDAGDRPLLGVNPADPMPTSTAGRAIFGSSLTNSTAMWKRRSRPTTLAPAV